MQYVDKNIANLRKNNTTAHSFTKHVWRANHNDVTYGRLGSPISQHNKYEDKIQETTLNQAKELINVFWNRTTIQGVFQVGTRKSIIWKLIWILIGFCGAAMALYQSRDVLNDYYGDSTIQKLSFKSKEAPFPAVSICKTLRFKLPVTDSSSTSDESLDHDILLNETYEPKNSLNFVKKCKFGTITCNLSNEIDIFPWSNPKYGSCFTFNPGFKTVKTLDTAAGLNLIISMTDYPEESYLSDFTIIVIHQSQTPPSLYSALYNVINPRDLIIFRLRARELIKLAGSTECILPNSKKAYNNNIYYSEDTPYIFTTFTCQKTCEITRRQKRFGCLDPSSVINATGKKDNVVSGARYCNYTEVTYDIDQDFRTPCICGLACRETFLEENKITTTTVCKNTVENDTTSCAVVKISYGNVPYEIIEEKRKYSDADFWGIIGGNVGLWVGICIISLFEIFELAVNLALLLIKNKVFCQKKTKKPRRIANVRRIPYNDIKQYAQKPVLGGY